jgi:hypothetical protein
MRKVLPLAIAATLAISIMAAASPGAAAAPQPTVVTNGHCSGTSTWRLTLKRDHARIEADVEVQTSTAGQQWQSRFTDNGILFGRATRTTLADGSFSATRFAANQAGSDLIRVRSVNATTGEVCRASGTF